MSEERKIKMIGIIVAMESELKAIESRMNVSRVETIQDTVLHYGTLGNEEIVLCLAGVGKCKAAMSATIVLMKEKVDVLINVGVAGGLKPEQNVMDMVISNQVIQADFDTSPVDGEAGIGMCFDVDDAWIQKGIRIAQELNIPYSVGAVATQDIFMADEADFAKLMKRFPQSACAEMEGGAIAQVASSFNTPYLVLRSLSDVVCHDGNPMEFQTFAQKASQRAGEFIEHWCK